MSGPNVQLNSSGQRNLASSGGSSGPDQLLAGTSDGCCCASSSSNFDCTVNPPSSVAIVGYYDGMIDLSSCTGLYDKISSDCVWDGTFQAFDPSACLWTNAQCFNGDPCWDCSISGKRMWPLDPPGLSQVYYVSPGLWELQISIQNGASTGTIVWQGQNSSGYASGVYTKTGGCAAGPATLTIA
ncbi:MAG TPA: hypothetical protein VMG59_06365 [Phycisphaerae bacterium]|nr:hypothetical protein [Phycisphaerae bacterium]